MKHRGNIDKRELLSYEEGLVLGGVLGRMSGPAAAFRRPAKRRRLPNLGTVGILAVVVGLSVTCVALNILLALYISTPGSKSFGPFVGRLLLMLVGAVPEDAHVSQIGRGELADMPREIVKRDSVISGVPYLEGVDLGNVNISDSAPQDAVLSQTSPPNVLVVDELTPAPAPQAVSNNTGVQPAAAAPSGEQPVQPAAVAPPSDQAVQVGDIINENIVTEDIPPPLVTGPHTDAPPGIVAPSGDVALTGVAAAPGVAAGPLPVGGINAPPHNNPDDEKPAPINGTITFPWWWVDFEQHNQTFLDQLDQYLLTITQYQNFSLDISEEMLESFQVRLPPLLPSMRNPCWMELVPKNHSYVNSLYGCHINFRKMRKAFFFISDIMNRRLKTESVKWRMRCFPSFFLMGVAKCGTTDLYEALVRHPKILVSELKEPEYWSRQRFEVNPWLFQEDCPSVKPMATFTDYLDSYDNTSEALRRTHVQLPDGTFQSDALYGDFSTHTFQELFSWDRSKNEPEYITAHHLYSIRPETKFIVIFRDPVERAYSRYKMRFTKRGNVQGSQEDFHKRMLRQVTGVQDCIENFSIRACLYQGSLGGAGDHTILANGMYVVYLRDWLTVFPVEQFKIIQFEHYIQNREKYIDEISDWLGIGSIPDNVRREIQSMPAANIAQVSLGGMFNDTRKLMQSFYTQYNQELVELLGAEAFSWGY